MDHAHADTCIVPDFRLLRHLVKMTDSMRVGFSFRAIFCAWLVLLHAGVVAASLDQSISASRTFAVRGKIERVTPEAGTVLIAHEAISNYMDAMTMPFKVKNTRELNGLQKGDAISFQLHVT